MFATYVHPFFTAQLVYSSKDEEKREPKSAPYVTFGFALDDGITIKTMCNRPVYDVI